VIGLRRPPTAIFYLLATILIFLPACLATVTPPPPVVLNAAGSTSLAPLLADLAAVYSAQQPHITFDIQSGGSQLGQMLVESGRVDMGMISWPAQNLPGTMRSIPIARDAVAIILHPDNKIESLSLVEVQDIFSGRLLNWREVDGLAGPIQVVSREDGSGTRAAFETLVMADERVTPTAIVLPNSQAVVDYVAQHAGAVGYVSLALVTEKVYAVPLEGIPPTLDSLTGGNYPLTRELSLLVPRQSQPELAKFVEFSLSPAGQAIVAAKWGPVR
jgi:phosphate transport system substrate-binding protein